MTNTKEVIGLFRNRLNIGTLELLKSGEYLFLINHTNRERLLKDNFPFDNYFRQGETEQILKSPPHFFRDLVPVRMEEINHYGITPNDSEWARLVKSAIYGNPKSDSTYIQVMHVSC